jgi:two-component system OmpR family response regulator
VRVLIAEDDEAIAEALRFALQQSGYAVDRVHDGANADAVLKNNVFSLLVLDLGLPRMDGFEVLRRLRHRNANLPVLILSARDHADEKVRGFDLGADDYLVKPFSLAELNARVRALLRRTQGSGQPVLSHGDLTFDPASRTVKLAGQVLALSTQELGLLEALMRRFGRVVSKEKLVEELYTYDEERSYNAIEVYVSRLRKKIAGSGVTVRTLYRRGYVLDYANQTVG